MLRGKLALVTGGGRGIGAAIARRLATDGASVVVAGRSEAVDEIAREIGGRAVRCDLSVRGEADALAKEVGDVAILVNNAGIAESATLAQTDDALWDRVMEIDATSPYRLIRALAPAMVKAGWGRVVNVASNAGISGYAYTSAYCAAKHAMIGYTRALAIDLARTGVTINAVCPGWVETEMADRAVANIAKKTGKSTAEAKGTLEAMSPQRRMIQPEEVAHVVAMLCGDDARGVHGQAIPIDGGQVLR
jgi:NAD(P)-dependent dehydrogenase (short-subunit alcohol dehydrogenase family)